MLQGENKHKERERCPTYAIDEDVLVLRLVSLFLQVSERIQTNTERLGCCVALWDDLRSMEQDINDWTSCSIADLSDSVTDLSDKERTENYLSSFQVRAQQ